MFGPADVHVPVGAVCAAPFASVSVTSTCSPGAGTKPAPASFSSVTVNVCGAPTSFVALGAIEIRAPTGVHVFVAGPELRAWPFVVRVRETPATETVVLALIVVVPVVGELICTVHEPVPPEVVHELGPTNAAVAPPAFDSENEIVVPSGAFTKLLPEPSFTFTCPVSVWFVPTGFDAVSGVIWMFASTNVFTASPEFGATPLVSTCTVAGGGGPTESVADA